jgi:hypothetical protein
MTYKHPILAAISLAFVFSGCAQKSQPVLVEKAVATPTPAAAATPTPFPKLPPPSMADVGEAMQRIFGDVLSFTPAPQSFIVGDLNGDGSEDLAVIARAAPNKLDEINSEVSNWIVQDAGQAIIPSPKQTVVKMDKAELPKIMAGETVLAIIHGYGAKGWRNAQARQAYLIKNAGATFEGTAPSISQRAIRAMHLPMETDVIKVVRENKKGFVFWTGGAYAWHPRQG